ncbi:MAG: hypothetical protein RL398_2716 [Planctomycetota bacterium]
MHSVSHSDTTLAPMSDGPRGYLPHILLGTMILVWGGSYAVVKASLDAVPPFTVIAVRFWLATLCLLPFAWLGPRVAFAATMRPGLLAGLALGLGYNLQTFGMQHTSASTAGFLAGMIVPGVAIGGWLFFGARFGKWSTLGLLCAVAGMAMLCTPDPDSVDTPLGIAIQIGATLSYVCHILLLSRFGKSMPTGAFCTWQMVVTAAMATACLPFEDVVAKVTEPDWNAGTVWMMAYLAVLASALGIGVQSRVQHRIPPMHLAILFALQPLFAAFFGWLTLGERLGAFQLAGGAAIVVGVVITSMEPAASKA